MFTSHIQLGNLDLEPKVFVTNSWRVISDKLNHIHLNEVHLPPLEPVENIPATGSIDSQKQHITNTNNATVPTITAELPTLDTVSNVNIDPLTSMHKLTCPHGDLMTFWKPPTLKDLQFVSPFANYGPNVKYVTFEPDVGGWNNIRMQMEIVLVFAYATGRILVLPPDQPMYLLNAGKGHQKAHSFADFFPFDYIRKRLPVITMEEFMQREAITGHLFRPSENQPYYPPKNRTVFLGTEREERLAMWDYLRNVSSCPLYQCMKEFLVIPVGPGVNVSTFSNAKEYEEKATVFAAGRSAKYYDEELQTQKVIHFISKPGLGYRLLEHFYTFMHFEDDEIDRVMKRFVRDYIHYIDIIFCKAAFIVDKLRKEGGGQYSSFHVRR